MVKPQMVVSAFFHLLQESVGTTTGITHIYATINPAMPAGNTTTPDSNGIPVVEQGGCGGATASQEAMKRNFITVWPVDHWHTTRPVLP